jgi:alanine racemase
MPSVMDGTRPTHWIEVDAGALRHNLGLFRRTVGPGAQVAAVVKANAYGHGLAQVAPVAAEVADWLAVHAAGEARALRGMGLRLPIMVMGFVPPWELDGLDRDTHLLVSSAEALAWVGEHRRRTGVSLPVHLKVDTGTHRQGVSVGEVPAICRVAAREGLELVGVATHFANIEDTLDHGFAGGQRELFERALGVMRHELGEVPPWVHASCSAAALLFRECDYTLVRVGISAYGHWPSRETQLSWVLRHGRDGVRLEPVLAWKALVGQLQHVAPGETVGYGRTWTALRPTLLAVLPVGYADGYPRSLGNRARVLVRGVPAPVVGRVCMNIVMVDVSDVPGVGVGEEVVLIGRQGERTVTVEELAGLADTINYELLARLSPSIPRVVVDGASTGPGPSG